MGEPRLGRQALRFKGLNLVGLAQGEADVVKAVEQAILAEGLHVERDLFALGAHDDLAFQVDGELVAGEGQNFVKQLGHRGLGQHDGQQAVLEAVIEEDVGKAGGDDGAKAILVQRPGGVLAARSAAEVLARQQDGGARIARLVQHEVGVGLAAGRVLAGLAVVQVAPFVKQVHAKAGFFDRLEKLLGDDGVGIDVLAVHGRDNALEQSEFLHGVLCYLAARSMALPALPMSWPTPLTVLQPASTKARDRAMRVAVFFMTKLLQAN